MNFAKGTTARIPCTARAGSQGLMFFSGTQESFATEELVFSCKLPQSRQRHRQPTPRRAARHRECEPPRVLAPLSVQLAPLFLLRP